MVQYVLSDSKLTFSITVSIHALTQDATCVIMLCIRLNGFQSTRLRKMRHVARQYVNRTSLVSIHAPTRDATKILVDNENDAMFQSTRLRKMRQAP